MFITSRAPSQETVYLYALGYYAVSRCAYIVPDVAATWLLSSCCRNKKFGIGLGDRVVIVGKSWLNGCNVMDGLGHIFRPSILITDCLHKPLLDKRPPYYGLRATLSKQSSAFKEQFASCVNHVPARNTISPTGVRDARHHEGGETLFGI